jgi:hypothetical protein
LNKIHTLLILYQLYSNFNNLCEEAKIIFVLIINFGDAVWGMGPYFKIFDFGSLSRIESSLNDMKKHLNPNLEVGHTAVEAMKKSRFLMKNALQFSQFQKAQNSI